MKKTLYAPFFSLLFFLLPSVSQAVGVTLAAGRGIDSDLIAGRVGLAFPWQKSWLATADWHLSGYWELSYAHMHDEDTNDGRHSPHLVAIAPVFRWQQQEMSRISPYIEFGVGASFWSQTRADERKLSTAFQFEDRLGIGVRFGQNQAYDIKYGLFHYSNASIKQPNTGVNMQWLVLSYWL